MEHECALPMSERDLLTVYNHFCKVWEFEADGKIDALIRKNMIKDLPKADELLIGNMNKDGVIKNLGEENYYGFKIETENHFETHLYLADMDSERKIAVSVIKPIFTSSNWVNVVIVDRKYFCLDVEVQHTGTLVNFFGSVFAACYNCQSAAPSRGLKYLYREVLANLFLASVLGKSAKDMRKFSDPVGMFTDETNKLLLEYNEDILSTMQKGKPYIPTTDTTSKYGKLNDLLIVMSLLEFQQLNSKKDDDDEDYGEETDEGSDSV